MENIPNIAPGFSLDQQEKLANLLQKDSKRHGKVVESIPNTQFEGRAGTFQVIIFEDDHVSIYSENAFGDIHRSRSGKEDVWSFFSDAGPSGFNLFPEVSQRNRAIVFGTSKRSIVFGRGK